MMNMIHGRPMFAKVCIEGHLIADFVYNDQMRIKNWIYTIRKPIELIPRSTIAIQQDQLMIEKLSKNITYSGLTREIMNFLRLCAILDPMQEIMSRSKSYGLSPRDSLKSVLHNKWQRIQQQQQQTTQTITASNSGNNNNINLNNGKSY
jgi:LIM domain-binding protein 2